MDVHARIRESQRLVFLCHLMLGFLWVIETPMHAFTVFAIIWAGLLFMCGHLEFLVMGFLSMVMSVMCVGLPYVSELMSFIQLETLKDITHCRKRLEQESVRLIPTSELPLMFGPSLFPWKRRRIDG